MSKIEANFNTPIESVVSSDFSHLEGRLLTLIEGMGLPEKQENAIKSQIKSNLWNSWAVVVEREVIADNGLLYTWSEKGWKVEVGYTEK